MEREGGMQSQFVSDGQKQIRASRKFTYWIPGCAEDDVGGVREGAKPRARIISPWTSSSRY